MTIEGFDEKQIAYHCELMSEGEFFLSSERLYGKSSFALSVEFLWDISGKLFVLGVGCRFDAFDWCEAFIFSYFRHSMRSSEDRRRSPVYPKFEDCGPGCSGRYNVQDRLHHDLDIVSIHFSAANRRWLTRYQNVAFLIREILDLFPVLAWLLVCSRTWVNRGDRQSIPNRFDFAANENHSQTRGTQFLLHSFLQERTLLHSDITILVIPLHQMMIPARLVCIDRYNNYDYFMVSYETSRKEYRYETINPIASS